MSYPYTPPRASRRQHFLLGLFVGLTAGAALLLLLAVASHRSRPPKFAELALICSPAGTPFRSSEELTPARLESNPPQFFCFGGVK